MFWLGVGLFATFAMDMWGLILHWFDHQPLQNYAILGRYLLTATQSGHLIIPSIATLPALPYESLVGWLTHITVGLIDAFIYMVIIFRVLHSKPHLLMSLVIAWALMIMPMLIEQPLLGMGIAASHSTNPEVARILTFSYHTVFGLGLFTGSVLFEQIDNLCHRKQKASKIAQIITFRTAA